MLRRTIIAAALVCAAGSAQAACPPPFAQDRPFFLDISPSDGPLEVFCRIQRYPGRKQFNVWFMTTAADDNQKLAKTFDLDFRGDGAELPGTVLQELLQSILPAQRGPALDPQTGLPFSRVWGHVVQGAASSTPTDRPISLAMPAETQIGTAAMLWEHVALQVYPVELAGANFTLSVELRPNPGRLMYELSGAQPALVLGAWRERLPLGSYFHPSCSSEIPVCKDLPETVPVHLAMSVAKVVLRASGDNISGAAEAIIRKMGETPGKRMGDDPNAFDPVRGQFRMEVQDQPFHVLVEATPGKVGTGQIRITWQQDEGQGYSWIERMWKSFQTQRETLVRAQSAVR